MLCWNTDKLVLLHFLCPEKQCALQKAASLGCIFHWQSSSLVIRGGACFYLVNCLLQNLFSRSTWHTVTWITLVSIASTEILYLMLFIWVLTNLFTGVYCWTWEFLCQFRTILGHSLSVFLCWSTLKPLRLVSTPVAITPIFTLSTHFQPWLTLTWPMFFFRVLKN